MNTGKISIMKFAVLVTCAFLLPSMARAQKPTAMRPPATGLRRR